MKKDKTDGPVPWKLLIATLVVAYVAGVSLVDRFAHPNLTETELLLRLPKTLVWMAE